jgi:hypothetical protein
MVRIVTLVTLLMSVFSLSCGAATARETVHRHKVKFTHPAYVSERPPLTVNRRSFLDPGPVVPVGSLENYVTSNTIFNRTPDQIFRSSSFGNAALPAPLEVPGRPSPIVEFSTPRYY